jgi:colicin import membrane protein
VNWFSALSLAALCSACASTPAVDTNVSINFPSTAKIESVRQADQVLVDVELARAQIEWRYQQIEQICYAKFFTNSCLLDAKDQRRIDLAKVKKSEVEANFFKRKHTVEEMDRELLEKNKQKPLPGVEVEVDSKE